MNKIFQIFKKSNLFIFFSIIYFFYYVFLNYYHNEYDFLHFYEVVQRIQNNQDIYLDFNLWYGPHIVFFFKILKIFHLLNYYTILALGFFQNLLIAFFLSKIARKYVNKKDEFVIISIFVISLFSTNFNIHNFYWDYYAFLFIVIALFFFLEKNYLFSGIFSSLIFFLKQTQGIFFLLLITFIIFYRILFKKDNTDIKFLAYYFFFSLFNIFLIYLFSDIHKYYNNSIKFIYYYSTGLYGGFFDHLILILKKSLFILIDSTIIFSDEFWEHRSLVAFYFTLILGFHLFLLYFFLNINKIFKDEKFVYYAIIFATSCFMPTLIGRGYYSKIFLFFLFSIEIIYLLRKNYFKFFKISVYLYSILLLTLVILNSLIPINFNEDKIIRSKNNPFLNINHKFNEKKDAYFINLKQLQNFSLYQDINNIFVFGNDSRLFAILNEIKILNHELYFNYFWQPKNRISFNKDLLSEIYITKPNYLLFTKNEFDRFIKDDLKLQNILSFYEIAYKNETFTLLKKN